MLHLKLGILTKISIDLLAILQKSLDRAIFLYISTRKVRLSGVTASITVVRIRKFYEMYKNIARSRLFCRIAKRSIIHYLQQKENVQVGLPGKFVNILENTNFPSAESDATKDNKVE